MLSMEPSIKRGLTFWDRALMPRDEFEERVRLVRDAMKGRGHKALVVAGNMYEDADLAYLIGVGVDGVLVVTQDHDPVIFTASGSRESFFLRELTWITELSHRGALVGGAVREALAADGVVDGRIGLVGLQALSKAPYDDLVSALHDYDLEESDDMIAALRRRLRPREIAAIRISLGIAQAAAEAAMRIFAAGASNAAAVVEAERVARLRGAWDVRILANLDGDDLRPFERCSTARIEPLKLWIATRYQGYWAEAIAPHSRLDDADRALTSMIEASRGGASAGDVARAGLAQLPDSACATALAYGLGGGVGAALACRPAITPDGVDLLCDGAVLSLRVFAPAASGAGFASRLVEVTAAGGRPVDPLTLERTGALPEPASRAISL